MNDDDIPENADDLARQMFCDADTLTASVLQQLDGFAANPMIALDHDPRHLAEVDLARATAALRRLCQRPEGGA